MSMDSNEHKQEAYRRLQAMAPEIAEAHGMRMAGYEEEQDAEVLHRADQLKAMILRMEQTEKPGGGE